MKKIRVLIVALVLVVMLIFTLVAIPAYATNPTVSISVTAGLLTLTNTESTWTMGYAVPSQVIYFSANGSENDTYSTANNTGNLVEDVAIQGTNLVGTSNWTLGTTAANQTYSLYANSGNGSSTYNTEVKTSAYSNLVTNLGVGVQYKWSMKFTAPTIFSATEDGSAKSGTVTLVASQHT